MNMIEKRKQAMGQGGFTLIELLVVIAILAVLGGAVIIGIGALTDTAEEQVCDTNKETIELAAEAEKVATEGADYATVQALVDADPPYIKDTSITPAEWTINTTTGVVTPAAGFCGVAAAP